MTHPIVGFAGLAHLGLNSAVAAAAKGFSVLGYDNDRARVHELSIARLHVLEPQLPELLNQHRHKLTFSSDPSSLSTCDIVYIAADVPTNDQGESNLAPIRAITDDVMSVLRSDALLVILCQVPPGFTAHIRWPRNLLYYQVETLIFGRAIERALHPERFMLGCGNPTAPIDPRLREYLDSFGCPILPMRYESAELAKIAINMCLIAAVSMANTLSELCEEIGADWSEIVPALKLDRRIGPYSYLSPGLGISGGNLERDLATVISLSKKHGTDGRVVQAWKTSSEYRKHWAVRTLRTLVLNSTPEPRIAVLGLTYKEDTNSIKTSPAIELLTQLPDHSVHAFDPAAPDNIPEIKAVRAKSAIDAIRGSDVLLVMTPWPEFASLRPSVLSEAMNGRVVIDPYKMLNGTELVAQGFSYAALGEPIRRPPAATLS